MVWSPDCRELDSPPQHFSEGFRRPALCDRAEVFAVVEFQAGIGDTAETVRLFEDRVENGREITGRRIDNPQHFGSGGLLFEGLARLGDKPRILDRDYRLISEGARQLNLLIGKTVGRVFVRY